jgi:hypothetical protein
MVIVGTWRRLERMVLAEITDLIGKINAVYFLFLFRRRFRFYFIFALSANSYG